METGVRLRPGSELNESMFLLSAHSISMPSPVPCVWPDTPPSAASLKTRVVPGLTASGEFRSERVQYLDSEEIRRQLLVLSTDHAADGFVDRLGPEAAEPSPLEGGGGRGAAGGGRGDGGGGGGGASARGSAAGGAWRGAGNVTSASASAARSSRHLPIFLFSVHTPQVTQSSNSSPNPTPTPNPNPNSLAPPPRQPLYLDGTLQARVVDDMVIAVQSSQLTTNGNLQCNGRGVRGVAWRGVAWRGVARRGVAWREGQGQATRPLRAVLNPPPSPPPPHHPPSSPPPRATL